MKTLVKLMAATAALAATPALAAGDSESYVINLSGSVASHCELYPEGSSNFTVDMLSDNDQGSLAISYSCNSPYTVSLKSKNGGMRHEESNGAVNIDYAVEANFYDHPVTRTNSANMQAAPVTIVTNNNWQSILTNGKIRHLNLDLDFDSYSEWAVAGTYSDELTITLAATL